MGSLLEKYRERYPFLTQTSPEMKAVMDAEAQLAVVWGYSQGYHEGALEVRRAIKDNDPRPFDMEVLKKEDGYWLFIKVESGKSCAIRLSTHLTIALNILEEITHGANAPQTEEVAQATGFEGMEETTPSGATDAKSEVAP